VLKLGGAVDSDVCGQPWLPYLLTRLARNQTTIFGKQRPKINSRPSTATMSMFRAKKLDLGCFVNIKVIRDHTKRKVFAENEVERQAFSAMLLSNIKVNCSTDKHFGTSFAT
jgi:hypothetical protein